MKITKEGDAMPRRRIQEAKMDPNGFCHTMTPISGGKLKCACKAVLKRSQIKAHLNQVMNAGIVRPKISDEMPVSWEGIGHCPFCKSIQKNVPLNDSRYHKCRNHQCDRWLTIVPPKRPPEARVYWIGSLWSGGYTSYVFCPNKKCLKKIKIKDGSIRRCPHCQEYYAPIDTD